MILTLDRLCYEDAENGGEGWAVLLDLPDEFEAGVVWTRQVLDFLEVRGLAEHRRRPSDQRRTEFALTERGAEVARELADAQPPSDTDGEG